MGCQSYVRYECRYMSGKDDLCKNLQSLAAAPCYSVLYVSVLSRGVDKMITCVHWLD